MHSIYFQLERIRAVGCGRDLALGMDDLTSCDKVIHVPGAAGQCLVHSTFLSKDAIITVYSVDRTIASASH